MIRVAHIIAPGAAAAVADYVVAHVKYCDPARFEGVIAVPDRASLDNLDDAGVSIYKGWAYCYGAIGWADIVNIHWQQFDFSVLKVVQALGKPHLITVYGIEKIPLIPAVTINSTNFIFQGQPNGQRCIPIPTGVDLARFTPLKDRPSSDKVTITRSISSDGGDLYSWLALYKVLGRNPEARLWIAGSANDPEQSFGQITFIDKQEDIVKTLSETDIVVCVSGADSGRGLEMNVMQALAMGVVCVAADTAFTRALIQDGENGFLVPPGDQESLISCVETLIQDGDLRKKVGQAARQRAVEQLDIRQAVPGYEAVYEGVLAAYGEETAVESETDTHISYLKAPAREMMRDILQEKNNFVQNITRLSDQIQADRQPSDAKETAPIYQGNQQLYDYVFAPVPMLNAYRSAPVSSPTGDSRLDHIPIFYKTREVIGEPTGLIATKLIREKTLRKQCISQKLQLLAAEFQEIYPIES